MRVVKDLGFLLKTPGDKTDLIFTGSCDIMSITVAADDDFNMTVTGYGGTFREDDYLLSVKSTQIACFPLDTYQIIKGDDGITKSGIYEASIQSVKAVSFFLNEGVGPVRVLVSFIDSTAN